MVEMMMEAAAMLSALNVALLLGLLFVYGNGFRKIKAQFTAGLLFFTGFFLLQNLIALYSYVTMFMYFATDAHPFVMIITVAQTAGLAILLWTSVR